MTGIISDGGVQLHRAGAERDHRRVEADVLALEPADVAHHLRFGVMRVEDRMRQVGDVALQRRRRLAARTARRACDAPVALPSARVANTRTMSSTSSIVVVSSSEMPMRRPAVAEVDAGRLGRRADGGARSAPSIRSVSKYAALVWR